MAKLVCESCNEQVKPEWKFCRFCGSRVSDLKEDSDQTVIDREPKIPESAINKKLYLEVLSTRADRERLSKKKKELKNEIESLLEQVQSGLVSRDYATPKIKELKQEVQSIKEEENKFADVPEVLPIEELNGQIKEARERLQKLKNIDETEEISKETINESISQTKDSIATMEDEKAKIAGHLKQWKQELKDEIDDMRKQIEKIYLQFKTDQLEEETYKERKSKKNKSVEQKEFMVKKIDAIIN